MTAPPYSIAWDTSWLPDQDKPIKIMARIIDANNLCYMTDAVENIIFKRTDGSVRLYKCYDIPEKWSSRANRKKTCNLDINDDLTNAVAVKMYLCSWNGDQAEGIGINDKQLAYNIGKNHDLSYDELDVPINYLKPGVNVPYTYSSTKHHGIEVQWPGMPLKIRYKTSHNK